MATMSIEERDVFLEKPRYGILTSVRKNGSPIAVPVWFDWDGQMIRMFAGAKSPKIKRLEANPGASLLVINNLDEHEAWVAFDGAVTIKESGGFDLAEALAPRYWNLADPKRKATLDAWRESAAGFRLLEMQPQKIRTYLD
jgi:predicted pyridoxine 5'-phosphate oxidase superfamily flavin-nucleotide-binding protein